MINGEHAPPWRCAYWVVGLVLCFCAIGFSSGKPVRLLAVGTPLRGDETGRMVRTLLPKHIKGAQFVWFDDSAISDIDPIVDAGVVDGGMAEEPADNRLTKTIERARDAALAFDLVLAAELWRRVADDMLASGAIVVTPKKSATILIEAGAASLAAGESDLALQYFRKAIAVDGQVQPGPSVSPDAKLLFKDAQTKGPLLIEIPRDSVLRQLCDRAGTDGVAWVAAGKDGDEWAISSKIYLVGDVASKMETRRYKRQLERDTIETEAERFASIIARKLFGDDVISAPRVSIIPGELKTKRPWYQKWWVYTIGGVLIAGGAAGFATYYHFRPKEATLTTNF